MLRIGRVELTTALAVLCFTLMTSATAWAQSNSTTDAETGVTPLHPNKPAGSPSAVPKPAQAPTAATCLKANPFNTANAVSVTLQIQAAGYTNVRGLYQGCDALWRGHAFKNGIDTSIMVTPTGRVIKQGY